MYFPSNPNMQKKPTVTVSVQKFPFISPQKSCLISQDIGNELMIKLVTITIYKTEQKEKLITATGHSLFSELLFNCDFSITKISTNIQRQQSAAPTIGCANVIVAIIVAAAVGHSNKSSVAPAAVTNLYTSLSFFCNQFPTIKSILLLLTSCRSWVLMHVTAWKDSYDGGRT